eukprot:TRINITY_DN23932_c0_g2_i2.p1 TRINITY_DN23932_c0_g2~~TRINITY_DN23932_c0_g2_i2.p1  ORF type:complete len:335 (+),score=36.62 TRINITY_DN23932_c0_g2_i2:167-1171(+)
MPGGVDAEYFHQLSRIQAPVQARNQAKRTPGDLLDVSATVSSAANIGVVRLTKKVASWYDQGKRPYPKKDLRGEGRRWIESIAHSRARADSPRHNLDVLLLFQKPLEEGAVAEELQEEQEMARRDRQRAQVYRQREERRWHAQHRDTALQTRQRGPMSADHAMVPNSFETGQEISDARRAREDALAVPLSALAADCDETLASQRILPGELGSSGVFEYYATYDQAEAPECKAVENLEERAGRAFGIWQDFEGAADRSSPACRPTSANVSGVGRRARREGSTPITGSSTGRRPLSAARPLSAISARTRPFSARAAAVAGTQRWTAHRSGRPMSTA